ncbi:6-phospho-3-hexuloisomerase [Planomicrobium sp. CPCC 101110]|uniref:6-phospho-3-hexuloisomerase n=1 Tax=Planomicrobium sp. CPCC 101110 TaxID=2599619 RepID=UPI0011B6FE30|nr:6-phospho-3-hexuloisomerase [Planomicrobium sp. CPCC 101110]TWT25412.1 SIS domain-containing protein [Planomicrobium sp. CPCC 101110]
MTAQQNYIDKCSTVLDECTRALQSVDSNSVAHYLRVLMEAEKVFFIGVGRVLLSLKSICKRYSHLGINAIVVGDITEPAITGKDVLVVGSGSGETLIPLSIAGKAKKLGATVVHIGSNPESSLSEYTDVFIRIPVSSKLKRIDEIVSRQPMTSLFEQSLLLFGDITAMMILEEKNIPLEDLWQFHANLE